MNDSDIRLFVLIKCAQFDILKAKSIIMKHIKFWNQKEFYAHTTIITL